jgi:hypothetical protein
MSTPTALLIRIRNARRHMLSTSSQSEQRDLAVEIAGYVADLDELLTHRVGRLPSPWDPAHPASQRSRDRFGWCRTARSPVAPLRPPDWGPTPSTAPARLRSSATRTASTAPPIPQRSRCFDR